MISDILKAAGFLKIAHALVEHSPSTPARHGEISSGDLRPFNFSATDGGADEKYTSSTMPAVLTHGKFLLSAPAQFQIFSRL